MKRSHRVLAAASVLVAVAATGVVVAVSGATHPAPAVQELPANTVKVEKGKLSAVVSVAGTLTYRGRSDGSPYTVVNQPRGTYTKLPDVGDEFVCGDVLYRVDDAPVLLLCGTVPAYRGLRVGDVGNDVRQLNSNLHNLGYDTGAGIDPADNGFTSKTANALAALQRDRGVPPTGALALSDAVFLPDSVRIANVATELGGSAQPATRVVSASSDTLEVQVHLEASQQGQVQQGDVARITLPGNRSVTGRIDRLGRVAQVPAGKDGNAGPETNPADATVPGYISLDDPAKVRGLDSAPVQVDITTRGVEALSVPVTAILGKSGGGFAVEVVHDGGQRALVAVELGLFDSTAGRVQVEGDLREGDPVVVPSS